MHGLAFEKLNILLNKSLFFIEQKIIYIYDWFDGEN